MLKLNEFNKVLVEFLREDDKFIAVLDTNSLGIPMAHVQKITGKRIGVVVATGDGIVGWSLCNSKDEFDKEKGLSIALSRAHYAGSLSIRGREELYQKVPFSMEKLFNKMLENSTNNL